MYINIFSLDIFVLDKNHQKFDEFLSAVTLHLPLKTNTMPINIQNQIAHKPIHITVKYSPDQIQNQRTNHHQPKNYTLMLQM